jgi:hypothetical protein
LALSQIFDPGLFLRYELGCVRHAQQSPRLNHIVVGDLVCLSKWGLYRCRSWKESVKILGGNLVRKKVGIVSRNIIQLNIKGLRRMFDCQARTA